MRIARRSALAAALAATATALAAAPAHAVNRYVSTAGTANVNCIQADPCSLTAAVAASLSGDTIIVSSSGGYALNSTLTIPAGVTITGVYGDARPMIGGTHGVKLEPGATAVYLGVAATGPGEHALELDGATARDVVAWNDVSGGSAVLMRSHSAGTLLQDAVVVSKIAGVYALQIKDSTTSPGGSATVLATTVSGEGDANAIQAKADQGTQTIINTIAWGANDIQSKGAVPLHAAFSNFRPAAPAGVVDDGGNQTAKPCWIANDDVRPLSSSPTVDAGFADVRLGNDPYGVLRSPADIGGLEYQVTHDVYGTDCLYPSFDPDDPTGDPEPPTDNGTGGGDKGTGGDSGTGTGTGGGTGGGTTPPPPPADAPKPEPSNPTTSGGGTTTTQEPTQLPPATPPVLGTSVTVGESKGQITIRLPGTNTVIPLTADATIPVGAVIDATNGTVQLTSATDANGKTQTGTFWGGQFKVRQSKDRYTELVLAGDALAACKTSKGTKGKKKARSSRGLWGRDRGGRFRTRGRNGTATVRGTRWYTEDRCDGTLFRVTQGAIDVRDDVERRTIRLKAGDRYFADDKAAKKKKPRKRNR